MYFDKFCSNNINIDVPEWHELYKSGQKKTYQYIVRLDK